MEDLYKPRKIILQDAMKAHTISGIIYFARIIPILITRYKEATSD